MRVAQPGPKACLRKNPTIFITNTAKRVTRQEAEKFFFMNNTGRKAPAIARSLLLTCDELPRNRKARPWQGIFPLFSAERFSAKRSKHLLAPLSASRRHAWPGLRGSMPTIPSTATDSANTSPVTRPGILTISTACSATVRSMPWDAPAAATFATPTRGSRTAQTVSSRIAGRTIPR